jgi:hypothetical protein
MALEKPPAATIIAPETAKTYRPPDEKVASWYRVPDRDDSLRAIAERHGVSTLRLFDLNFPGSVVNRQVIPEVVNWYLHHHAEFKCGETQDKKNRRFNGGERIAIPWLGDVTIGEPVIGGGGGGPPADLKKPDAIRAGKKFAYEYTHPPETLPPIEKGNFAFRFKFAIEGQISPGDQNVGIEFKSDEIKVGVERELKALGDNVSVNFGFKIDDDLGPQLLAALKSGSPKAVAAALGKQFEGGIKKGFGLTDTVTWTPEIGLEASLTPFVLKFASFEYKGPVKIGAYKAEGEFSVAVALHVGLSKEGWRKAAQKVGGDALKQLLRRMGGAGLRVLAVLTAEGVLVGASVAAGTVLGAAALIALIATAVADARKKGDLRGLASWYVSAYLAKVFRESRPTGFITGDVQMRDALVLAGERDAVADIRRLLRETDHPSADASDEVVLGIYREAVLDYNDRKYDRARWFLTQAIEKRSRELVGL